MSLPAAKAEAANAPDFRVFCDGAEVGAAWERTGKGGTFLSVVIDDPSFARRVLARLFPSSGNDGAWTLHWSRQRREERV